jgi:serine/threonine-protein kinase
VITPEAPLGEAGGNELAISPDGRHVVYVANDPGTISLLYIRSLDDPVSRPLLGTEGAAGPFFSPDGESLAFFAGGKLKRLSVMGGPPMTLCDAPAQGPSGNWGSEDGIVFTTGPGGLYRVPATGGEPERLAVPDPDKGEVKYRRPHILPGGKDVLFTVAYASNNFDTAVLSLETGEKRIVVEGSRDAYYLPTGHLSYGLQAAGTVVVVPFDLARIEVMGEPVPTLANVRASITGSLDYAFSDEGTLVYSRDDLQRMLVWVDRQGTERPLIQEKRGYMAPRISPDGTRLFVTDIDGQGNRQVWIYEMARGILTPFTFQRGSNVTPLWTPDGERVTFHSHRIDQDIFWKAADGSGEAELLETNPNGKLPTSWSPDGRVLAFSRRSGMGHVGSDWDIWLLAPEGQGWEAQPLVQSPFNESHAMFSPDGGWVAFNSDRSGQNEVYVRPYPGEGGILPISTDGGREPVWARNGNELFYRNRDKMMVVAVQTEPVFKAETPRLLFEGSYVFRDGASAYDTSVDGEQFVMVKGQGTSTQIHVTLNWFEELKERVPVP